MRALTILQPHAEAIMRRETLAEYRPGPTTVGGRIQVYASLERLDPDEEEAWLGEYGIDDVESDELPRGVIVGTVDHCDCTQQGEVFMWHFMHPERVHALLVRKISRWEFGLTRSDC
jgi:hypothetical protein